MVHSITRLDIAPGQIVRVTAPLLRAFPEAAD